MIIATTVTMVAVRGRRFEMYDKEEGGQEEYEYEYDNNGNASDEELEGGGAKLVKRQQTIEADDPSRPDNDDLRDSDDEDEDRDDDNDHGGRGRMSSSSPSSGDVIDLRELRRLRRSRVRLHYSLCSYHGSPLSWMAYTLCRQLRFGAVGDNGGGGVGGD